MAYIPKFSHIGEEIHYSLFMPTNQLSAIMFTDIVGYTSMMQQDRERAMGAVKLHESTLKAKISQYEGELLQTYGDGSLSIFNSASAAIQCAKEIQEMIRDQVPLRIGLHIGEITRDGEHTFGDGVNIASRIESMGQAGTVLFSKDLYSRIRNRPEFVAKSLGKFAFKNVEEDMEVFALANDGFPVPSPDKMVGKGRAIPEQTPSKNRTLFRGITAGFIGVLIGMGIWLSMGYDSKKEAPDSIELENLTSLAVLGFENLSPKDSAENQFFCDGITEDIRTHLTKLSAVRVHNINSPKNKEIWDLAGQEEVDYLIEGNVRRLGNEVRVTAKLLDVNTKAQIWAESYDRELTGIFEIQSDIAKNIAQALEIKLSPKEEEAISPLGTDNLEAYKLYLKACYQFETDSYESLAKRIDMFKEVIEMDPDFAAAHASLGERYTYLVSWWGQSNLSREEVYQLAKEEFTKAIELNPYEPITYYRMATMNMHLEWDFVTAEKNILKALELAPNSAGPRDYYQWLYTLLGKYDESITYGEQVMAMQPNYAWGAAHLGLTLFVDGQKERALQFLIENQQKHPMNVSVGWRLAQVYLASDSTEKVIDFIETGLEMAGQRVVPLLATLGGAYARTGNRDNANQIIRELEGRKKEGENNIEFFIAMIYAGGKDKKQTLEWLGKSYEAHNWEIVWLGCYPVFDFLHEEPDYQELLRKIHLR